MNPEQLPVPSETDQERIQIEIKFLQQELEEIANKTLSFETVLRTQLSELIVEAQELHILYKAIKKAKKAKRFEQKKRGKNYREPKGLVAVSKRKTSESDAEEQQEKKRLYREAMLHVHPDKFSMSDTETAAATQVTTRLIEIYKTEDLETLRAYHAHIFQGNSNVSLSKAAAKVQVSTKDDYTLRMLERLQKELAEAKENQLYKVVTEYANPLSFVEELREYYEDRIFRLKKRTRKGL